MIWKVVAFFGISLLALSHARSPYSEQSVRVENYEKLSHHGSQEPKHHEVYAWSYPSYEFKYEVADPHTHDFKGHHETRNGDEVKGHYWLIQPDGLKRTVEYYADKNSGFKAYVDYNKLHHKSEEDNEDNEDSAGGEEENSKEESSSIENDNSNNEEEEKPESDNNKEKGHDSDGESASEQKENENHWRRNGVNYLGQRRGHEESNDDQNENSEGEQEAKASKHDEEQDGSENDDESGNHKEHHNGDDESSGVENKHEKRVIKHEYHFIIHHPKYIKKLNHH